MRRKEIVDKIAKLLKKVAPEADTILYGSEARGEARHDSDIDLLILLPDSYQGTQFVKRRSQISAKLYDLFLETGVDIAPLILPKGVWQSRTTPFSLNVSADGVRI